MPAKIKTKAAPTQEDTEIRMYELGYLLAPDIVEEELPTEVGSLRGILEKYGAAPFSEEMPGKRELAYEMSKRIADKRHSYTQGYFGWIRFELQPSQLSLVKDALESSDQVIRFLLTQPQPERFIPAKKPSALRSMIGRPLQKKEESSLEAEDKKQVVSEEDLDKTIEGLIVE